ncbi:MAG: peptidylprolyl isomerase [Burkholderiales bacterium]|nr:peptidylprolyl isomerase [Burkholderiales bacterium]
MFDLIQKHRRAIQVALFVFLIPPFLFFGVDRLDRPGGSETVADVGDFRITQQEFARALRERQEAIQRLTGGRASAELLDSAELRGEVLEALVRRQLLLGRAVRAGLTVSDSHLQGTIGELPAFQSDGKFSFDLYQQYLRSQGMAPVAFEAKVRQDLLLGQLDDAFGETSFVPRTVIELLTRISEQQREISVSTITPDRFTSQVKLAPDAAKQYYDSNPNEFRIPEQVRVDYVALSMEALMSRISIDPSELRKYYDEHRGQFEAKQERQASHILIAIDAAASAEEKRKAREKAEELSNQLKANPGRFAELAKQHSQDPGSAANGGDLGFFGRGAMPKTFEDTLFAMKPGEVSEPVETQYGFHVIRLTNVKGGETRSFEDARSQIETELKRQRAGRRFAEMAEQFNNIVFEQSDTLQPAAELAKESVRQSGWITREHAPDQILNNPKLRQAVFSEDVIANKRNSPVVEVTPGVLVAARLLEHKPAAMQPFAEVAAAIEKKLTLQRAAQLAAQEGRQQVEKLKQGGEAEVKWGTAQLVGRAEAKGYSEAVLRQTFRVDTAKLPAYAGIDMPNGGYTLIRVSRVVEPEKIDSERRKQVAEALRRLRGQEAMLAYVESLKQKNAVRISKELIRKKE